MEKDKKQNEIDKDAEKVRESKEMILNEYKQNLPTYMEQKLTELNNQIQQTKEAEGLSAIQIDNILRRKHMIGRNSKYSADQLSIIFDYYQQALVAINAKYKYPPTKENFCAFAGMSTSTYNKYLLSEDEEKQEIMLMIDDYIRENMLTSAQLKEVDTIMTMFRGKTAHGLVEATAPIIVEHKHETNQSDILARLNAVKNGESLKTIELKEDVDGVYK